MLSDCWLEDRLDVVLVLVDVLWKTEEIVWSQQDQGCVSWLINSPLTSEHWVWQLLERRQLEPVHFLFSNVYFHGDESYCTLAGCALLMQTALIGFSYFCQLVFVTLYYFWDQHIVSCWSLFVACVISLQSRGFEVTGTLNITVTDNERIGSSDSCLRPSSTL